MSPHQNPEREAARRLLDRLEDDLVRDGRERDRTAFPTSGRSAPASPLDRRGRRQAQAVALSRSAVRSPTTTVFGVTGQFVDGTSDLVVFERDDHAPRPTVLFDVQPPITQLVMPVSGRVWLDVQWRWGFLRNAGGEQDPSLGRFRCPLHLRVTRTRDGVTAPVDFTDPHVSPGGRVTDPAWSAAKGDVLTFQLLHPAGADRTLEVFQAGVTEVETEVTADDVPDPSVLALAEEDATGELWLVSIGTTTGDVTKVAEWSSAAEEPDFKSGMDVSGGAGWSQMSVLTGDQTRRAVKFDLSSAAVLLAEPDDTSTPDWGDAAPAAAAVGGGVLWTMGTAVGVATAYKVDLASGLDDGELELAPSASNTVSQEGRWQYHDGTLYGTPQLDDGNWYLLGFNPSTGAETSRVSLSAVVTEGFPVGLARRSDGTWWLADESGTAGFLRQFDPDDGSLVGSQQYSTGDWFVYGMAFQ